MTKRAHLSVKALPPYLLRQIQPAQSHLHLTPHLTSPSMQSRDCCLYPVVLLGQASTSRDGACSAGWRHGRVVQDINLFVRLSKSNKRSSSQDARQPRYLPTHACSTVNLPNLTVFLRGCQLLALRPCCGGHCLLRNSSTPQCNLITQSQRLLLCGTETRTVMRTRDGLGRRRLTRSTADPRG